MTFNSYLFLLFYAVLFTAYYSLNSTKFRKVLLLVGSYVFYAAWNPPFVLILIFSTFVDWHAGKNIGAVESLLAKRKWLIISLVTNLGLLAYFKYGTWMVGNLNWCADLFGLGHINVVSNIVLPVGISFYTFQTLSYTIDIYRGNLKPWDNALDYALYVTFFPQLVAGPIVRAVDFLPQCRLEKKFNPDDICFGLCLFIWGLFEKVVIADCLMSPVVDSVFYSGSKPGFYLAWTGVFAFSIQILCDFSGYSLCAIGIAKTLGYELPVNFRYPYAASSFSDFWKRWHISLSSWLKDYLYIPLGGSRISKYITYRNLFLVMLLGGLWHGAAWTFVFWGFLHGLYLVMDKIIDRYIGNTKNKFIILARMAFVYLLVCVAWVFFRAEGFGQAIDILKAMAGLQPDGNVVRKLFVFNTYLVLFFILGGHYYLRNKKFEDVLELLPSWSLGGIVFVCLWLVFLGLNFRVEFLYFQF